MFIQLYFSRYWSQQAKLLSNQFNRKLLIDREKSFMQSCIILNDSSLRENPIGSILENQKPTPKSDVVFLVTPLNLRGGLYTMAALSWQFIYRNSHLEMFCKKTVQKNWAKFTGKHLCLRSFFKLQTLSLFSEQKFYRTSINDCFYN